MSEAVSRWARARGRLIVSCQASPGEAFAAPGEMARFARAALSGGAGGIRAHGPEDVASIREAVPLPVLGIHKEPWEDGAILITPAFERAAALAAAGADGIALDCTERGLRYGAAERLRRIRSELGLPVMADIATVEEAEAAAAAGADFVLTTMRGFTASTRHLASTFEPEFVAELVRRLKVPVIAEGRVASPADARAAREAGAWAVVVGSAITRPQEITRRFAAAVEAGARAGWMAAFDLGASHLKYALVSAAGEIRDAGSEPTQRGGAGPLLAQLRAVISRVVRGAAVELEAVALATAGWVDPASGAVLHATDNLPGWTGVPLRKEIEALTPLPVVVENDAVCAAAGEFRFGAARGTRHALCLTLGTGIGGGIISEGQLLRGAQGLGAMVGHLPFAGSTAACTCGRSGCFEAEYRQTPEGGLARVLAQGLLPAVHLLDPERVILSGGAAARRPELAADVERELRRESLAGGQRRLSVHVSDAGTYAGVRGAAALAWTMKTAG